MTDFVRIPAGRRLRDMQKMSNGLPNPDYRPDGHIRRLLGAANRPFLAWDTEGAGGDATRPQRTIVLANSEAQSWTWEVAHPARTREMFDILCESAHTHSEAINVGFAFSYDVNMILRDVSRVCLLELWETTATRWKGYRIQWVPRHSFAVRRDGDSRGFFLWDVWGYFQGSFVNALKRFGVGSEYLAHIEAMKAKRGTFTQADVAEAAQYSVEECRLLVELCDIVRGNLARAGLLTHRFDGAGSVAAAVLQRAHVDRYIERRNAISYEICSEQERAYYGGRIEAVRYGVGTTVHEYDINSAYPWAAQDLPCLAHGVWKSIRPDHALARVVAGEIPFALWDVVIDGPSLPRDVEAYAIARNIDGPPFMPFPYRFSDGRIAFPFQCQTTVWTPEIVSALVWQSQFPSLRWKLNRVWEFVPGCDHRPFAFIPHLYADRQAAKRAGDGIEYVLKLGLNACYGKLAQKSHHGREGKFRSLAWAGWITSAVRAKLLRAALHAPDAIISFNTDAVFSTMPLPVALSDELGDWKHTAYQKYVGVQPGVYWARERRAKHWTLTRTRGFTIKDVTPEDVIDGWKRCINADPILGWEETRFTGMGECSTSLHSPMWRYWRVWRKHERQLMCSPIGQKRSEYMGVQCRPQNGLAKTLPALVKNLTDAPLHSHGIYEVTTPELAEGRTLEREGVYERVD